MAAKAKQRTPRGQAVVQRVLAVALDQLGEVGYARLSVPEVAAIAGVNKTSVYRRWPTKAALVGDALRAPLGAAPVPPDTGSLKGDLVLLAKGVADFLSSPQGSAVMRVLIAEGPNPELAALAAARYPGDAAGPREVIRRAIARGELSRKANGELLLFTIAGAVVHRVWVERRDITPRFVTQLVDLVLDGARRR